MVICSFIPCLLETQKSNLTEKNQISWSEDIKLIFKPPISFSFVLDGRNSDL